VETYGCHISTATEFFHIATQCIILSEETTILYVPASSSELLNDLCKDRGISTIEETQHDQDLIDGSVSIECMDYGVLSAQLRKQINLS